MVVSVLPENTRRHYICIMYTEYGGSHGGTPENQQEKIIIINSSRRKKNIYTIFLFINIPNDNSEIADRFSDKCKGPPDSSVH